MLDIEKDIEITHNLLIALGIEIQQDTNILIDQNTKSQISFENKFVKANIDINKKLYISEYDIKLDPLSPKCTRLLERLFGKFLDDSSSEELEIIPEVLTYFFDKDDDSIKYRLTIKFIDGTKWIGNWYFNKILCYVEAIFSIDGTFSDTDLRIYDVEDEFGK